MRLVGVPVGVGAVVSAAVSKLAITLEDISGTHDTGNGDLFENLLDEIVSGLEMLEEIEGSSVRNGAFSAFPGALLRKAKALCRMYEVMGKDLRTSFAAMLVEDEKANDSTVSATIARRKARKPVPSKRKGA